MDQPHDADRLSVLGRLSELLRRLVTAVPLTAPGTAIPKISMPQPPGASAGIEMKELAHRPSSDEPVRITCIDYSPENVQALDVDDLDEFLTGHRPLWSRVRWININGLTRMEVIRAMAEKYQLHPLAIEDVLHTVQRPKAEDYAGSADQPGRLFVVARLSERHDDRLHSHQISLFLGRSTLITFQEANADIFDGIRQRLHSRGSRLRENDVSFLLYAMMDAIVDNYFPLLEQYSERLEEIEEEILADPERETLQEVHAIKRELLFLQRAAWPMRELISQLQRDKHECLSDTAQTYFRDVYDHCIQVIDLVETYREITGALTETYISAVSNRTNEVMKVLTLMGTIFIPLTFLAGVYGMNMPIPEARWEGSYVVFWIVCAVIAGSMVVWFKRRGWL